LKFRDDVDGSWLKQHGRFLGLGAGFLGFGICGFGWGTQWVHFSAFALACVQDIAIGAQEGFFEGCPVLGLGYYLAFAVEGFAFDLGVES
jgi:hypothetical protein